MKKVLHILPVWSLATGPSQIIYNLLKGANKLNIGHSLAIFNKHGLVPPELKEYEVYAFPTLLIHRWKWSPRFQFFMETHFPKFDFIHLHGCWIFPNYIIYKLSLKYSIKYIYRPAGALMCQAISNNNKWIKKLYFEVIERRIINNASCIHVLSKFEKLRIEKLGLIGPIFLGTPIIPRPPIPIQSGQPLIPKDRVGKKILLSVCTISSIKNLLFLTSVLLKVKEVYPDFCWIIAGPSPKKYGNQIKRKILNLLGQNVWFAGEVNNFEKYNLHQSASIYLSASKSENFGVSIVEALMARTLVIAGINQPWQKEIEANNGYSLPLDVTVYSNTIIDVLNSDKNNFPTSNFYWESNWLELYQ